VTTSPYAETIAIRFTEHEHSLLEGLAELRGMTSSDLLCELIGFERHGTPSTRRHLQLVRTAREGGRQPTACLQ
jgi:hypothetical protein